MRPIIGSARVLTGARLAALLAAFVALAACSSEAAPSQSAAAALSTGTLVASAAVSPPPITSPTPSASAAVAKITPIPGAPDSGVVVKLTAKGVSWSVKQIDAPAGKTWRVAIDDRDTTGGFGVARHNFVVASGPSLAERIFQSPQFVLGTHTYEIPALPAGDYLFICTIHADKMTGALTIK
jgi:hypothetical protein